MIVLVNMKLLCIISVSDKISDPYIKLKETSFFFRQLFKTWSDICLPFTQNISCYKMPRSYTVQVWFTRRLCFLY